MQNLNIFKDPICGSGQRYKVGAIQTGGCFLNDDKSRRQVIFAYLHEGGE